MCTSGIVCFAVLKRTGFPAQCVGCACKRSPICISQDEPVVVGDGHGCGCCGCDHVGCIPRAAAVTRNSPLTAIDGNDARMTLALAQHPITAQCLPSITLPVIQSCLVWRTWRSHNDPGSLAFVTPCLLAKERQSTTLSVCTLNGSACAAVNSSPAVIKRIVLDRCIENFQFLPPFAVIPQDKSEWIPHSHHQIKRSEVTTKNLVGRY